MNETSVIHAMRAIVPITRFNKGEASRIFDEVAASGTKLVMKNNRPACVLMSPDRYETLIEALTDYLEREEADRRMTHYNSADSLSQEEMMVSLGIRPQELDDIDVEIEE